MQRKKNENREKAESYQLDDGTTGKQFMQELSGEITELMQMLRQQRDRISENTDILNSINIQKCLTELLEAVGSLQQGYGQVISQKIGTDEMATAQKPAEFEDRVRRVKSAIEKAKPSIATAQKLNDTKEDFIRYILRRIAMIFQPESPMDKLVKKLDAFDKQFKDKKADVPLRFFLPKPPEPKGHRPESGQRGVPSKRKS